MSDDRRRPPVRFPSHGHTCISKTKRDRPIVTMEQYIEVCTADCVTASKSSPDARWRDSLVSHKNVQNLIRPRVRLAAKPQLLLTEHDRRHTAGVVNCSKLSPSSVCLTSNAGGM